MATVFDVAAYILCKHGPMTAWKLQKLVYYTQAWSLVWDEKPIFQSRIEAWANGPVTPSLYQAHRGKFIVAKIPGGKATALTPEQRDTARAVLSHYGKRSAQWLSELTHSEAPWKNARKGLSPDERGNSEITLEAMAEYYEALP